MRVPADQHYCRDPSISRRRIFPRFTRRFQTVVSTRGGTSGTTLTNTRPLPPAKGAASVTILKPAHQNALNQAESNKVGQKSAAPKAHQRQRNAGDRQQRQVRPEID